MKLTETQLKTIILEEAAKVKKAISLRKQLDEVTKQLDEVLGGPHGGGKKTFKKVGGGFSENPGALVEKEKMEEEVACMPEEELEETFDFTEEELEEMLNMSEMNTGSEGIEDPSQLVAPVTNEIPSEEAPIMAEADKTSDPFTVDAPKECQLKESAEILRMKKLAGLLK